MSVLTESMLRDELKNERISNYVVKMGTIITPAARQYLKEKGIDLIVENLEKESIASEKNEKVQAPKFEAILAGGYFDEKPEYMTHLYGNKLVFKDHPRIVFRGKLDSLQSKILKAQVIQSKKGNKKIIKDLEEILSLCRNIMRSEVLEEALEEINIFGLGEEKIREMSHNPKKYFNTGHILPSWQMGETMILINAIRSTVRETEITCIKAFKSEDGVSRPDIIKAMNRLSSCVYIIMLRQANGYYH